MNLGRRWLIGGAIGALVLAAGIAMVAWGGDGATPAGPVGAVEAEMRRQGLQPAGRCPADRPLVEDGSCYIFIAQADGQCSFAVGPEGSLPDRLITVERSDSGAWETAAVTRLDIFVGAPSADRATCEP
jgi:hypothetical protein